MRKTKSRFQLRIKPNKKKASVEDAYIDEIGIATTEELEKELSRENYNHKFRVTLRSTINILIVVCAVSVLIATLLCPILKIYGSSMTPTLNEGQIVFSVKDKNIDQGEVIGVYYGSKILVKRCIAKPGQWVDIDKDGNVSVDGVMIDEPYVTQKALGECNINLPYQVPDKTIFVMGDHRDTSIDSRNTSVGCISNEDIVGKIVFRIWPLSEFGRVK